jgi:hypothetical protein
VGGVRDEGPLTSAGRVETVQHAVEGDRQPVDLVVRVGHRQPVGPGAAGDLLRAGPQRLDRAQGRADHPPGDQRQQRHQRREREQQRGAQQVQALGEVRGGPRDQHPDRGVGRPGQHHDHPDPAVEADPVAGDELALPVRQRVHLVRVEDRHQPVGAGGHRENLVLGVDHLHPYARSSRQRIAQRVLVHQLGHRRGGVERLLVGGTQQRVVHRRDQHQAAAGQPDEEHHHRHQQQPRPQAQPAQPGHAQDPSTAASR